MAKVCSCPIEMEPKTLDQGQLSFAREMAADAVQKMKEPAREGEAEAADGLAVEILTEVREVEEERGEEKLERKQEAKILETPCQCAAASDAADSPGHLNPREPLSAPF